MSTLNRMLRTIYSKLDEDGANDPKAVYEACEDEGELVLACLDRMSIAEHLEFLKRLSESVWIDSLFNIVKSGVAEEFDISLLCCEYIIQCGMNQYSYTDYLKELEYEKSCEDSETDNERNEYERSTLKTN